MTPGSCSITKGVVIANALVGWGGVRGVGREEYGGVWRALSDVCRLRLGAGLGADFGVARILFQNRFLEPEGCLSAGGLVAMTAAGVEERGQE